jgi:3-oxoacyl-[acyl-carrier protein] reductase
MTGLHVDLGGRRALVTGGGQGVGRAISLYLADAGAEVVVNDIDQARAEAVAAEVRAIGQGDAVAFDVTDWEGVRSGVERKGPFDILINNAGNAGVDGWEGIKPFAQSEPSEWARFVDVNLYGVMYCTRAALPGMIERGDGRIITVISEAARSGDANLAAYAAAKAGAAGFCRVIAREVGRYGITVNCVALGTIIPADIDPADDGQDERSAKMISKYVIRRRGQPRDAAGLVTYLASPDAEWITGQTYPVNGGYSFGL